MTGVIHRLGFETFSENIRCAICAIFVCYLSMRKLSRRRSPPLARMPSGDKNPGGKGKEKCRVKRLLRPIVPAALVTKEASGCARSQPSRIECIEPLHPLSKALLRLIMRGGAAAALMFYSAFCFLATVPSRKPFLNLRGRVLRCRMRPVPVVRLRRAFSAQLSARERTKREGMRGVKEGRDERTITNACRRLPPPLYDAAKRVPPSASNSRWSDNGVALALVDDSRRHIRLFRSTSIHMGKEEQPLLGVVLVFQRHHPSLDRRTELDPCIEEGRGRNEDREGRENKLTSPHAGLGEAAAGALAVLLVESDLTTPAAGAVGLLVLPLTQRRSTGTLQQRKGRKRRGK